MKAWYIPALTISCLLVMGCSSEQTFTIEDVKQVGFVKQQQQLFQVVGARDGWSGSIDGGTVELYEYSSEAEASESKTQFSVYVQEGNASNWVALCQNRNLLMLAREQNACDQLRSMD